MDRETSMNLVLASTHKIDGKRRIYCAEAFKIHYEHGIPLKDIGRICNENNVRICACQLGCFK